MRILLIILVSFLAVSFAQAEAGDVEDQLRSLEALVSDVQDGVQSQDVLVDFLIEQTLRHKDVPEAILNFSWDDFSDFDSVFIARVRERAGKLLLGFPYQEVVPLQKLAAHFLGEGSEGYKSVDRLFSLTKYAVSFRGQGDLENLVSLYGGLDDPLEQELVRKHVIPAIETYSQAQQEAETPFIVLNHLANLPSLRSEPGVKALGLRSLERINQLATVRPVVVSDNWPFDDKAAHAFVVALAAEDPQAADQLAESYSWWVLRAVRRGDIGIADQYYSKVFEHRPDPNKKNGAFRAAIVAAAKTNDAKAFAAGRLEEMRSQGELSIALRTKLFFQSLSGSKIPRAFLLTVILAISLVIIVYILQKLIPALVGMREEGVLNEAVGGVSSIRFGSALHSKRMDRNLGLDEYSKLLAVFDLTDTATEDDIKQAYRNKMKEHHPDSAEGSDPDNVQTFREYKKVYERLLEMRTSFFGN